MNGYGKVVLVSLASLFLVSKSFEPSGVQEKTKGTKRQAEKEVAAPPKSQAITPQSAFENLPPELKSIILDYLTTARGATNRARLDNAAENIRKFFRLSREFRQFGEDQRVIEYIITELANRYATGDKVAAVIALGTTAAGTWLANLMNPNDRTREKERDKAFEKASEHLADAARDGRINVVNFLTHFLPNIHFAWGVILRGAVKNDRLEVVKKILSLPMIQVWEINSRAPDKSTPLFDAVYNGNEQIVDLLLGKRASVNEQDNYDMTPLHIAADKGYAAIAQKLINAGANAATINAMDLGTGSTALMVRSRKWAS